MDNDNDGCSDANEAYNDANADGGDNEFYSTGNLLTTDSLGRVTSGTYPVPADIDTNSTADYREIGMAPVIIVYPPNTNVCPGCSTTLQVISINSDTFQWQTFNGTVWIDRFNRYRHSFGNGHRHPNHNKSFPYR